MTTEKRFLLTRKDLFQLALALTVSVAGVAVCVKNATFRNYYFTSDTLYMFDYFHSFEQGTLASFQYSHLPNLFPEGLIVVPLLMAHAPWQLVYAFYSASMFLVLTLSVRYLYQTIAPRNADEAFYLFIVLALPIFLLHPGRLLHVLLAGIHGGSFVVSVVAAIVSWRLLGGVSRRPSTLLIGLALMSGATAFSDVLFFFEFVIPLAVASAALALFRGFALSRILVLNLAVAGASVAGVVVLQCLPTSPFPPGSLQDLLDNSLRFVASIQASIMVASVLPFLVVLLCFVACLCSGTVWARAIIIRSCIRFCGSPPADQPTADAWLFVWVFGLAAALAGFGMTIIGYQDFGAYRYAIGFFWWPLILGLSLLAGPAAGFRSLLPKAACFGIAGLLLFAALRPTPSFWATELARCLEQNSHACPMQAGLADYWTARPFTQFSERKNIISPLREDGDPKLWMNNRLDYFTDKAGENLRDYDFVILDQLEEAQIAAEFGQPSHRFQCGSYDVAQYDDPSLIRTALARWFAEHK
jgi:hypothetical protein